MDPWGETQTGSAFAGAQLRHSSLIWNDHTALLVSCCASRKDRFAAMRVYEIGSRYIVDGGSHHEYARMTVWRRANQRRSREPTVLKNL